MNAAENVGHIGGTAPEQGRDGGEFDPPTCGDASDDAILDAIALRFEAAYEMKRQERMFQNTIAVYEEQRSEETAAEENVSNGFDAFAAFKCSLAQRDEVRRREREERGRKRLITDLQALDSEAKATKKEKKCPNVAAAFRANMRFWDRYIPPYVLGEISKEVGDLAERHLAHFTWLFVVKGGDLVPLMNNGFIEGKGRKLAIDGPGIVPLVARTRQSYCSGRVDDGSDPYYVAFKSTTCSEQAVPIVFKNRLLGVLNQESPFPGAFSPTSAKALEQDGVRLVRHLLALEAHETTGMNWNPDRHGWGFSHILALTIHQLKQNMDWAGEAVHLTAWYADPLDETLFALATTGYGATFLKNRTIPLRSSFTGALALEPDDTVAECLVGDPQLKRPEVDRMMGLRKVRAVTVRSCNRSDDSPRTGMVLSFYAFDDTAAAALPDEAQLQEISRLLRDQIEAYAQYRPVLAAAAMEETLMECADSADQCQKAAELIGRVLESDAVTIFARPRGGAKDLHVVAHTAPLNFSLCNPASATPPPQENSLNPAGYEVGDNSVTGTFAAKPDTPLRINSPRSFEKLPEGWPRRPSHKVLEHLPKTVSAYRRFLGYGVPGRQGRHALGVIRAVRSADSKPYTLCELDSLRAMGKMCADVFRTWRDWFAYTREVCLDKPTVDSNRLNVPIPRTSKRPIRALAHEILVDVYKELEQRMGDCVFQVAVLVERLENTEEPMQQLAHYWELSSAPPEPNDAIAFQKPRSSNATWTELLDRGALSTFMLPRTSATVAIRSGAVVPFYTWCGRHRQRGVLVVDLTESLEFGSDLIADLHVAARKFAAVLAVAGSTVTHSAFLSEPNPEQFLKTLCTVLRASGARLALKPSERDGSEWLVGNSLPQEFSTSDGEWLVPMIESRHGNGDRIDEDAVLWGVQEGFTPQASILFVPLRLGTKVVGEIVIAWDDPPPAEAENAPKLDDATRRALRIRDILALWSLWTWTWRDRQPLQVCFHRRAKNDGVVDWIAKVQLVSLAQGVPASTHVS
jgi:hypothetical protein